MKGRVFSYAYVVDEATGKKRTVKQPRGVKGWRWGYEFELRDRHPATGKRQSRSGGGFRTRREAQDALAVALAEQVDAPSTSTEPSKLPLSAFIADVWIPAIRHKKKATTIENYEQLYRAYVKPRIGAMPLAKITQHDLTKLFDTLSREGGRGKRPLSPMTVHHVHVLLSTAFGYAVGTGMLKINPSSLIPSSARRGQPKRNPSKLRYWKPEQAAAFRAAIAADRLAAMYDVALNLGLRRGELAGLQWADLDLDAETPTLSVRRQFVAVGTSVKEQEPKTDTSTRTIEVGPALVKALRDHRRRQIEERLALGEGWGADGRGWVFTREDGSPLNPNAITDRLERITRAAGVPWIGVHGLRHTCAVLSLAAGVPLKVVSERLGHRSTFFTADLYQHVIPGMQLDASVRIERVLGM